MSSNSKKNCFYANGSRKGRYSIDIKSIEFGKKFQKQKSLTPKNNNNILKGFRKKETKTLRRKLTNGFIKLDVIFNELTDCNQSIEKETEINFLSKLSKISKIDKLKEDYISVIKTMQQSLDEAEEKRAIQNKEILELNNENRKLLESIKKITNHLEESDLQKDDLIKKYEANQSCIK